MDLEKGYEARGYASIRAKLIELGYQAELDFLDELKAGVCAINPWPRIVKFEDHPLVKPAKPLTEKTWATMKDEMIKYITEASGLRKENMHCIAIRTRTALVYTAYVTWRRKPENLSRYPADAPMPNLADVLDFPPIKGMVHTRTERELDMDRVVSCLARSLHDEIEEWREDIASDLLGKVTRSRVWDDAQWWYEMAGDFWDKRLRFFERAVVVFRCTNRWMHYRWEEQRLRADVVLTFPCGYAQRPVRDFNGGAERGPRAGDVRRTRTHEALSMDGEFKQCRHAVWNADTLEFDEQASRATRNILVACCMDWKKTTTKQLDELDPRLVCLKCSFGVRCDGERKVRVWTWRDAVQHCLSAHFGDASVTWEYLCPEDAAQARQLEATECALRGFHPSGSQKIWRCIKCRDTIRDTGRMSWDALAEHFRRKPTHGDADNMDNKEGTMYYRAMDVFPREGPPVKMIPSKKDPAQAWKYGPVRPRNPFLERLLRSPSP
ncbi:hypothetical protein BJ912DRAFT_1060446 [Pholiota molesta]|nr:hypothetical protein BJ912DRAFT_1060446 [Pholiota molesta]